MAKYAKTNDYSSRLKLFEQYLAERKRLYEQHCQAILELDEHREEGSTEKTKRGLYKRIFLTEEALRSLKRSLDRFSQTAGDIFADALTEGSASVERAIRSLAKSIISDLVSSMIQLSYQQAIAQRLQKLAISQNFAEAASVWNLVAAYQALAAAKMAASAIGLGFPFLHAGGQVMHFGGEIRRAHSGLRADEVGPFILQRGEYVINRSSAQKIGYDVLDFINRTGKIPMQPSSLQININLSVSAVDSRGVDQLVQKKIIPSIRRATEAGIKLANKRAIYK